MIYLITYDLNKAGKDYAGLIAAIKSISANYRKPLLSVWVVETNLTPDQIYNRLASHIDADDLLFITRITREQYGWLKRPDWDWLNSSSRNY